MNKFEFKKLTPFKWFILENFPFIEADFDALTEWQLFCKLGKEMNKIINSENTIGTQMENVTNAFIELQNYVNTYFDNLDVQDEINNKLNEMADSGVLADIIADYIQLKGILAYNTVNDMKLATNLVNGSFAETYGFYNINDKGGAKYKIRNITNNDTVDDITIIALANNLIAELIINSDMNIKQFGAKGDNLNNDTLHFKKAIEKLDGGSLLIPSGIYLIYENINLKNNISIIGENKGSSIVIYNKLEESNENNWLFNCNNINNIRIENLTLKGIKEENDLELPTTTLYYGLSFINSNDLYVNNCIFMDFYANGISLRNSKNIIIENSLFANNSTNAIAGTRELENIKIINNTFINNLYSNINFENNESEYSVNNISIIGNTIKRDVIKSPTWAINFISPSLDIDIIKHKNILILDNYIENFESGITIQHIENVKILNNTILNTTSPVKVNADIDNIFKSENIIIDNNKINATNTTTRIIRINNTKNIKITNNDISGGSSTATNTGCIVVTNSLFADIINNVIHDNSLYGINIFADTKHINIYNNLYSEGYVAFIRVNINGDLYLHCDNNVINDTNSLLSYTVRFANDTIVNYVILERFITFPNNIPNSTQQFGTNCIVRNNGFNV